MEKIQLLTAKGEPVAIVEIPVFASAEVGPDVLVWGSRFFKEGPSKKREGELWTYVECFAFHVLGDGVIEEDF